MIDHTSDPGRAPIPAGAGPGPDAVPLPPLPQPLPPQVSSQSSQSSQLLSHALPQADFDGLSTGVGDPAAVRRLSAAEQSVNRALIARALARHEAWREIVRLDESGAQGLDEVFAHPYVRSWAARRLHARSAPDATRAGKAYGAAIAAAAALRSGESVSLTTGVKKGIVFLPTIGALVVGGRARPAWITTKPDGTAIVDVDGRDHCIGIAPATQYAESWLPRRRIGDANLAVWLEDSDPYRDGCGIPVARRQTDDQFRQWQERITQAARCLADEMPDYFAAMQAGLTVVTPLTPHPDGHPMSGTARHAFSAVSVALPPDGPALAQLLVHEFQHTKLGALLDLFDLFDVDDDALYYAPWRDDPRPLEGLLQGSYAFVAVTDFWRVRRQTTTGTELRTAEEQFVRWRVQTSEAIDVILHSGSLTPLGERFVQGMAEKASTWFAERVNPAAARAALDQAHKHRSAWDRRSAVRPTPNGTP